MARRLEARSTNPAALILSRQTLPTLDRSKYAAASGLARGAYVLADPADGRAGGDPDRHRQRGLALRAGATRRWRTRACAPASSRCRAGSCSRSRTRRTATRVLPPDILAARRGRAGGDARLGALCRHARRDHRHAQLRRLGAAQGAAGRSSASRSRRSRAAARAQRERTRARRQAAESEEPQMNPLKQLETVGQSPWLDYVKRSLIEKGELQDADRARRAEGRHLQPVDLREGDRRERRIRRCAEGVPGAGPITASRRSTSISRSPTSAPVPTCCGRSMRRAAGATAISAWRCSPYLANDTEATIDEARRLWRRSSGRT